VYTLLRLTLTPLLLQLQAFAANLPDATQNVRSSVLAFYQNLHLSAEIRSAIDSAAGDLGAVVGGFNPTAILPVVSSVASFVISLFGYVILPAWMFYLLKDRPRLQASFERALPVAWRGDAAALIRIVNRVVGQWIRGQVLLGLTVGLASYVGVMLLGAIVNPVFSDYAVLLAVISGVLELLPIIGPIIAVVPAAVVGLNAGPQGVVAVVALYFAIQQVENNVLVPKIQSDAVRLHPSAVVFFLVVGGAIAGLLGAILSLPLAAMGRDIVVYLFHRLDEPPMSVAAASQFVLGEPAAVRGPDEADVPTVSATGTAVSDPTADETVATPGPPRSDVPRSDARRAEG
jgi:predicted PurR-regulated permease PerM